MTKHSLPQIEINQDTGSDEVNDLLSDSVSFEKRPWVI